MPEQYTKIKTKSVTDSDGFSTDYTMYFDNQNEKYIFMFGDVDYVEPDIEYADWECETEEEANQWFDNYFGFDEENENIIPIKIENTSFDDCCDDELASIFGGDTKDERKALGDYMKDQYADSLEESLIPIIEKLSKNDIEQEIIDCVGMGFETGHITYDNFNEFKEEIGPDIEELNDSNLTIEDAWNFYNELINMGPSGFYDEYRDVYDFSEDYIREYGEDEDEYEMESINIIKESNEEDVNNRIYTALDNIAFLANEYQDADEDLGLTNLKQTIEMIEESVDTLKNIINEVVKSR